MSKKPKNPMRLIPIRMDARFVDVLDRKARAAKLSREAFIRRLIEKATRVKSKRRPQSEYTQAAICASY